MSYGALSAIWDHSVLPATRHKFNGKLVKWVILEVRKLPKIKNHVYFEVV